MGSESNGEQSYQTRIYAFPGNGDRGALGHAFMAVNNQDDASNDENKLFEIKYPKPPETLPKRPASQSKQAGNKRLDPATTLLDLQLPEDLFSSFLRLLQRLGYGEPLEKKAVSRSGTRSYTHICSQKADRYLLYIPEWIIADPNTANSSAIAALGFAFKEGSYLVVFYASSKSPHIKIQQIIQKEWTSRYKGCEIVPQEQIQQLICCDDEETQKLWIEGILGL
jgi:hypothetical protein